MTSDPTLIPVLVAPQMGENIGAVARAMGNFNLSELRIVKPRDGWPNAAAAAMAAHAKPIIEQARCFDTLTDAIADCHIVFAATVRPRDMHKPSYHSKNWLDNLPIGKVALLFGRENNGLSNEEISLAHGIIHIPVSEHCPSINLAQSAAILCYEWFQHQRETPKGTETLLPSPATQGEMESFFARLESLLDQENFWRVKEKKAKMWQNLRTLFLRCHPSSNEVNTLHGVLQALISTKKEAQQEQLPAPATPHEQS